MTVYYPSVQSLEHCLWLYLSNNTDISNRADVSEIHPQSNTDLLGDKGRVVISTVDDLGHRPYVTRSILDPSVQLACWHFSYAQARQLQELVISAVEDFTPTVAADLGMIGQRFNSSRIDALTGVNFDRESSLYFSAVTYQFNLGKE